MGGGCNGPNAPQANDDISGCNTVSEAVLEAFCERLAAVPALFLDNELRHNEAKTFGDQAADHFPFEVLVLADAAPASRESGHPQTQSLLFFAFCGKSLCVPQELVSIPSNEVT